MACNIFEEAQAEPMKGKIGIGLVTVNRVRHPDYPKTVCGVVWAPQQFDWTVKPRAIYARPGVRKQWEDSTLAATMILLLRHQPDYAELDFTKGSVNFHARGDVDLWPGFTMTTKIGNHRFFIDRRGRREPLPMTIPPVTTLDILANTNECVPTQYEPERVRFEER
jgi:spore germination cell wall hydrolase CwlJ-like protein